MCGYFFAFLELRRVHLVKVAVETTTQNYDDALWKNIKPVDFVFEGIRNVVANRLATSARQWCEIFARFNSGTSVNELYLHYYIAIFFYFLLLARVVAYITPSV